MKTRGSSSDLVAIFVYAIALVFLALYVWRWTADETWGPGGSFSYEFSPGLRLAAGLIAMAFVGFRFAAHVRRCFRPTSL
jgi:hypothetical protein